VASCVSPVITPSLACETGFDLLDAGLERRHLLFQLGEVAGEGLALAAFVGEARLDPAQCLHDRLILLLQAFEPAVDLVEMAEQITPQLGNLPVDLIKSAVDLLEAAGNDLEAPIDLVEAQVNMLEALINLVEALINLGEPPPEEVDQLFVLARSHGAMINPRSAPAQAETRWFE
jgi:hypothetical protein